MRRFSLVNSQGLTYDLTDNVNCVILAEVNGLGLEREDSYRAVGNRYIRISKLIKLNNITGNIYFFGEHPYSQYREFINFCASEPLYLKYTPEERGFVYTAMVNMPKIDKSELDPDTGALKCSVDFSKMTTFYREVSLVTRGTDTVDKYSFQFSGGTNRDSVVWDRGKTNRFRSSANMNVIVDSDSYEDSPCKLIIHGPVQNPSWSHYVDGFLISTGKVNCVVPNGYCLVVDTIEELTYIRIYDLDLKNIYMDVYQLSDFSTNRFLYLKHGKNSIQVSSESADIVTVRLEARLSYVSV